MSDVDEFVPEERVRESAEVFEKMGANVTLRVYPGMDHIVNVREWMERHVMGTEDFGEYLGSIQQEEAIKG